MQLDRDNRGYEVHRSRIFLLISFLYWFWEKRSRFVMESEKSMLDDITPSKMSDEEPLPDGKIARKRSDWHGEKFNKFMDELDARANSSFKQSAHKERILSSSIEGRAPTNVKDWMKE